MTAFGVALALAGACSSSDSVPGLGVGGSSGAAGTDAATSSSGGASGTRGSGGSGGPSGAAGCGQFAFVASGVSCVTTGCASFSCDCPDAFPISIAKCTSDGCLVGGNCPEICAAQVDGALRCADTYTVASPLGTGGTGSGTGGAGGTGATGGVRDAAPPPRCSSADVHVPAESAVELGTSGISYPKMIADETGALYLTGNVATGSDVDLGGGVLPSGTSSVLFKLDASKQHVWSHRFGSTFDRISSLSFASNGDLLMGGWTAAQTDLGGGAEPASATPQLFVARYDRDGKFVKSYLAPAPTDLPSPPAVVETPSGDILVFQTFTGTWSVGGKTLTSAGEADIVIVRFAAAGTTSDVKQFGHARNDLVFDAVGASDGSVYVIGFSYYMVDFGKNPIDLGTDFSSFVVKLDATLSPVWQRLIGSGSTYPRHAFLDGSTLVVAGDATGSVFYADKVTGALPSGHTFVLRIDTATGTLARGDTYETTGSGARVTALASIPGGGVALGGYIKPPADFGGGLLTSLNTYEPFLAEYDSAGKPVYSTLFCTSTLAGGADGAIGSIARDANSTVLVAPFSDDYELGSKHIIAPYGSVLVDMPPEP